MKKQTYYNTPYERLANVCDNSRELCVNCVGAVDDSTDFNNHSVRRDYYMMYVLSGSMQISFDGAENVISAGDVLIMKPGTNYSYSAERGSGMNYIWIHFTGSMVERMLADLSIPVNRILNCGTDLGIIECWRRMCNEFVIKDDYFHEVTAAIFIEILTFLSRKINRTDGKRRLMKSILYIHENYQKKISIEYLASLECMSESHYRAVFTKTFGESPTEYIASRRIDAAMYMLEHTDKKLSEVSSLSGYGDICYFERQFKRKAKMTPGAYRNKMQK